jgi:hypothetical protein
MPKDVLERLPGLQRDAPVRSLGQERCGLRNRLRQTWRIFRIGRASTLAVPLFKVWALAVEKAHTFPRRFAQHLQSSSPPNPIVFSSVDGPDRGRNCAFARPLLSTARDLAKCLARSAESASGHLRNHSNCQ